MSVASRLISGSAAAWTRILVTLISQVALVPIYLTYWSVETYGAWLAIHALETIMVTLGLGHQTFLGFEFLRLARHDLSALSRYLWSGIAIGLVISVIQLIVILFIIYGGIFPNLLGHPEHDNIELINAAGIVLILLGFAWLIASSSIGLFTRVLEPFGYHPRLAWWGVLQVILTNFCPAIAVFLGADLLVAGIVHTLTLILLNIPIFLDTFFLMRKENIKFSPPSLILGYRNFLISSAVAGKLFLETARQQGVRVVLAPLSGASGLAAFSTMRTGSNVALQGLSTITHPLMPELMRFLHTRDQIRTESAFGTVWVIVVALMAPAVVILQVVVEPLFTWWTQGQIEFSPALFAILSLSVLVYASTKPAMAVVEGNNLMKPQLILSILAAVLVVGGIALLIPWIGIAGAGVALLSAEIAAAMGYTFFARGWMEKNTMIWPSRIFLITITSVLLAGISMGAVIAFPEARWLVLLVSLLLLGWNFWRFWKALPILVTQRVIHFVGTLPVLKRFFPN